MPITEVFLDTSYALALSSPNDRFHERAVALAEQLEAEGTQLVTTRAVVLEIGHIVSKIGYQQAAFELLAALEADAQVEIIPVSEQIYARALQFYQERQTQTWSITDCISVVVMQERGLREALTTATHFQEAGFRVLLWEVDPEMSPQSFLRTVRALNLPGPPDWSTRYRDYLYDAANHSHG
jgi:predicted nucleic acid-binding protein